MHTHIQKNKLDFYKGELERSNKGQYKYEPDSCLSEAEEFRVQIAICACA